LTVDLYHIIFYRNTTGMSHLKVLGTYITTFSLLHFYERFITQVQLLYSLSASIYYKSLHRRSILTPSLVRISVSPSKRNFRAIPM
jgi:hypothetical protein